MNGALRLHRATPFIQFNLNLSLSLSLSLVAYVRAKLMHFPELLCNAIVQNRDKDSRIESVEHTKESTENEDHKQIKMKRRNDLVLRGRISFLAPHSGTFCLNRMKNKNWIDPKAAKERRLCRHLTSLAAHEIRMNTNAKRRETKLCLYALLGMIIPR